MTLSGIAMKGNVFGQKGVYLLILFWETFNAMSFMKEFQRNSNAIVINFSNTDLGNSNLIIFNVIVIVTLT